MSDDLNQPINGVSGGQQKAPSQESPTGVNLPITDNPPSGVNKNSPLKIIFASIAGFLLVASIPVGVYLVQKNQEIREKAAGCDMRWPADPNTDCGKKTQSPAQGATNVSLTPNFHWDYGGYRTEDKGQCVNPSGCSSYGVSVYIQEGSYTDRPFARCDIMNQSTPPKDAPFSCFRKCDYGNVFPNDPNTCHTDGQPNIDPLKPNTTYYWRVTPYFDGKVHAEQGWNYYFSTAAQPTATPTPTTTPTPILACLELKSTPAPAKGQKIKLSCVGNSHPEGINHFEFRVRINNQTPIPLPTAIPVAPLKEPGIRTGEIEYTIPNYGCYQFECRACTSVNSSRCTEWGKAQ